MLRARMKKNSDYWVEMLELVREHPRYGYRFITALLRREGWSVNRKRVHRLWRQEGLQVPKKQRKKRRLGTAAGGCVRRRAEARTMFGPGTSSSIARRTATRSSGCRLSTNTRENAWRWR